MSELVVTLKRRESRRLKAGHPWVFANEVERVDPVGAESGLCRVMDDSGRALGLGYFNRHSLICARLLTDETSSPIDVEFFHLRLSEALEKRRRWYSEEEAFRWVYGEADSLPGLIVDHYPEAIVVQVTTRGMDELADFWQPSLRELAADLPLIIRNDTGLRSREGLPLYIGYPDGIPAIFSSFKESGVPVVAMPCHGQKTGFFLDQRENRIWSRRLAKGARVLDLYCYTGAWGISMMFSGAVSATFVDSSDLAIRGARRAADLGGCTNGCTFYREDATRAMDRLLSEGETFDVVMVDPPDLVPTRKSLGPGRKRFIQTFTKAIKLVAPGGFALCSCCSYHLEPVEFQKDLRESARRAGRKVEIIWSGSPSTDHPRPVAMPEADYLKFVALSVS